MAGEIQMSANDEAAIRGLAARHGLTLVGPLSVNELGLDYRVVMGDAEDGTRWVLRIPRRPDVGAKVGKEAQILALLSRHVPFAVPAWRVVTPELVAYPMLTDSTAMVLEHGSMTPTWMIDQGSLAFADSFAEALAALHAVPVLEAARAEMTVRSPEQARQAIADDIEEVRRELEVNDALYRRWQSWLDDDTSWPGFSVLVHGDLYVGHVVVDRQERVSGMIDWSEARVDDPAIDMSSHLMVFGQEGLERLITGYEKAGGRTWPRMAHHVAERAAVFPVNYALFALRTGDDGHLAAAKAQLAAG